VGGEVSNPRAIASGIPVYCVFDELVDITHLVPNPRNPNCHPEKQLKLLAKIIQGQGWRAPITVSTRSGFIVRGHGRLMAAQLLGVEQVPVDRQDYATEAEEWADLVADNRIAELAEMDDELLKGLLLDIQLNDFDMDLTGFEGKQLDSLVADLRISGIVEDDFDLQGEIDKIKVPVTQLGDVWVMGNHRLMCGDSTRRADVEKLMDNRIADMNFTDPPYNVDYSGGTKEALKIKNDKMKSEEYYQFLYKAHQNMIEFTSPGGAIYLCHSDSEDINVRRALQDAGWLRKQTLVWVKNGMVISRQDYHWRHEVILYGWKPGAAHRWYGGRRQNTVIDEDAAVLVSHREDGTILFFSTGVYDLSIKVPSFEILSQGDDSTTTIWRVEKPVKNEDHPTMKPIRIPGRAINNSSKKGDLVLDLFGGAGSTLIAAEQTDRICFMMELDEKYCDVIIKRFETFTGQKAMKAEMVV
jgi:DNA modification methylase